MNRVLRIYPLVKGSKEVSWEEGSNSYKFNSGLEYSDAFAFPDKQQVVVLFFAKSNKDDFVGKVFDYSGKFIYEIPFPNMGRVNIGVYCLYSWASEIDNGVKMVFGTNSITYRDFWCDFDLDEKVYTETGEAR